MKFARCVNLLMVLFVLTALQTSVQGSTYNLTDYGGKGDAIGRGFNVTVNVTSNSPIVTGHTFVSGDVGKDIEIFYVGMQTNGMAAYPVAQNVTNNMDFVGYIYAVNGGNAYVTSSPTYYTSVTPQLTTNGAVCIYGTSCTLAMSNVLNASMSDTNVTIVLPLGTNLFLPYFNNSSSYAWQSITLHRGGYTFTGGDGTKTNTIMLSRGAWQNIPGGLASYTGYPFRGMLFLINSPVTTNYPLYIENMTLDGGVQNGWTPYSGVAIDPRSGLGWDQQHSALVTEDSGSEPTGSSASMNNIILTNLDVTHWRGEEAKYIDQNTNVNWTIVNCIFEDGNATALNLHPGGIFISNIFGTVNGPLFQLFEFSQIWYTNSCLFAWNTVSNITGNGLAINGSVPFAAPILLASNRMWFNSANNGCELFPANDVSLLHNEIHGADNLASAFILGDTGVGRTFYNSNIVIALNTVSCDASNSANFSDTGNNLGTFVSFGTGGLGASDFLTVTGNTVTASTIQNILGQGTPSTNTIYGNNTVIDGSAQFNMDNGNPMVLIQTNNFYTPLIYNGAGASNLVDYGRNGPTVISSRFASAGEKFYLEDDNYSKLPAGAVMTVSNAADASLSIIVASQSEPLMTNGIAPGQIWTYYWHPELTPEQWTTNVTTGAPPLGGPGGIGFVKIGPPGTNWLTNVVVSRLVIELDPGAHAMGTVYTPIAWTTNLTNWQTQVVMAAYNPPAFRNQFFKNLVRQ